MAKSAYLGNYNFSDDNDVPSVTFQIPENCIYKTDEDSSGIYTISVTLKPGVKKPSEIFVTESVTLACDENYNLEVGFFLPEERAGLELAKKPKIVVNSLPL